MIGTKSAVTELAQAIEIESSVGSVGAIVISITVTVARRYGMKLVQFTLSWPCIRRGCTSMKHDLIKIPASFEVKRSFDLSLVAVWTTYSTGQGRSNILCT